MGTDWAHPCRSTLRCWPPLIMTNISPLPVIPLFSDNPQPKTPHLLAKNTAHEIQPVNHPPHPHTQSLSRRSLAPCKGPPGNLGSSVYISSLIGRQPWALQVVGLLPMLWLHFSQTLTPKNIEKKYQLWWGAEGPAPFRKGRATGDRFHCLPLLTLGILFYLLIMEWWWK